MVSVELAPVVVAVAESTTDFAVVSAPDGDDLREAAAGPSKTRWKTRHHQTVVVYWLTAATKQIVDFGAFGAMVVIGRTIVAATVGEPATVAKYPPRWSAAGIANRMSLFAKTSSCCWQESSTWKRLAFVVTLSQVKWNSVDFAPESSRQRNAGWMTAQTVRKRMRLVKWFVKSRSPPIVAKVR